MFKIFVLNLNILSFNCAFRDDFWEAVTFEVTPRMSTYLLAFVVGDVMPHAENRNKGVSTLIRFSYQV